MTEAVFQCSESCSTCGWFVLFRCSGWRGMWKKSLPCIRKEYIGERVFFFCCSMEKGYFLVSSGGCCAYKQGTLHKTWWGGHLGRTGDQRMGVRSWGQRSEWGFCGGWSAHSWVDVLGSAGSHFTQNMATSLSLPMARSMWDIAQHWKSVNQRWILQFLFHLFMK